MANDQSGWRFEDLQNRYERAQLLANDCVQDFAGNYFFASDRSPKGYWTTTRRQPLDYVCDCPDFAFKIDQQLTNDAPSRWVRSDWSTNPDNRILVNRCIHCFAVAIAERELDPRFPINRIYSAKRSRFPRTDCGCGCGGSGGCGCPNKELGLPEPKLIQGCDTDCYVEPLTPRTLQTPSTNEGIPAYQTFEIPTIQFTESKYRACSGGTVTITLARTTSQGFNNATVSGFPVDVQFPFEPEFRTSSQEIIVDLPAGNYVLALSAIASGNFGEQVEALLEVVDCNFGDRDDELPPCEEQEFVDFGGGGCEGSFLVGFRQTGLVNPDGTCEQIKVLKFDEGSDCGGGDPPPPVECESTVERDCTPLVADLPKCVNTGSGDGFNSNAGFNAVVRVRTGNKTIEYLRPDRKECEEVCEFEEIAINVPSCPDPPPKPAPPPFCPIPVKRFIGWARFDSGSGEYIDVNTGFVERSSVGTAIVETFQCDDGTIFGLRARTARCMPPANRFVDSFEAANYQGNRFGEGCCPFDETKPPRPVCPPKPISKWSCFGGVCSPDPNGIYNSKAECEAALIPPPFTGGQCLGVAYAVQFLVTFSSSPSLYGLYIVSGNTPLQEAQYTDLEMTIFTGQFETTTTGISSIGFVRRQANGAFVTINGVDNNTFTPNQNFNTSISTSIQIVRVLRKDGQPDNCGDLPSNCPP